MSHLINFPLVRVSPYQKGYIVEARYAGLRGYAWRHIIGVRGVEEVPWVFSTKERAIEEATKLFRLSLIDETNT